MKIISIRILTFALFGFLAQSVLAQSPFVFEKIEHDFGEIYETAGVATAKFVFKNTGIQPLYISKVDVSCGCTTPEYSKDTLQPGESSFITAKYDPMGRPGAFDKTISIVFNNNPGFLTHLKIKGIVISNVQPQKKKYSIQYGSVSMDNTTFDFGELKGSGEYTKSIKISNDGFNSVRIFAVQDLRKEFKISHPQELKPGDSAVITLTVNKSELSDIWGDFSYRLLFITNDVMMSTKILYIKGKVSQDFSHLSKEQLKNAPKVSLSLNNVDFGEIKPGGKSVRTLTITNNGKSNLEIRNIHAICYCLSGVVDNKTLAPGESVTLTLTFDSIGQRAGTLNRSISIYTNDPNNSEVVVHAMARII